MGIVYLAHDPHIDRQVAIKLLPSQFLSEAKYRERFQREARTIARLDHPVIVPVYDFGEHAEQPFIVMRYMAGGSLVEWIRHGKLPLQTAVSIVTRIASTLAEVHQQGIIHRDLKPSNILLDNRGDAYLSDFGIVKVNDATLSLTGSSSMGTPAYMSPEQIRNDENLDHRTDIYALGVILFELLTGKRPFAGETILEQIVAHTTEPIPNIYDFNPELPPKVDLVIQNTLAKEPAKRYKSMTELVSHLTSITTNAPKQDPFNPIKTAGTLPANPQARPTIRRWIAVFGVVLFLAAIFLISSQLIPVSGIEEMADPTPTQTVTVETAVNATNPPTSPPETAVASQPPDILTQTVNQAPIFHIISTKESSRLTEPEANLGLGPGQTTLLGLPFEHGWKISTECEIGGADRPTLIVVPVNNLSATKAHFLLQAGQGLAEFSGQKIGELVIIFANGQSFGEPLILGDNIRDWRRAMPETYVNSATSANLQEAWRGKEGNTDGRIDLFSITLPDSLQNQLIREIQIVDTSVQTIGTTDPCIHLIAITLESQPN